ncbi:MAG: ATP-binding cassette domain-containing protein [Trebonia sp.]
MLIRHLRARRADVAWLAFWSLVQALPIAASGWSLAEATSRFLAGDAVAGLAWLGLLAVAGAVGAFGTRQSYLRAGAIVEPLRDSLVTAVVAGALERSTKNAAAPPDTRAVARLTHQAEIVRDSCAGLLLVTATFACTVGSGLAGLVTLVPATLPYVLPPLLVTGLMLRLLLRPVIARQRAAVLAEEEVAEEASRTVSGLRDVSACGAENHVRASLSSRIARAADATRAAAVTGSARVACLAVGGWLPLLLVLAAAPSMFGRGVSPGAIVGALTYIIASLRGALYTASEGMGTGLVRLYVTLERIQQTAAVPEATASPEPPVPAPRTGTGTGNAAATAAEAGGAGEIVLRDVRFAYGPDAEPVVDGLSLRIPPGDHLAIAGPSGIGKSSLAALIAGILSPGAGEVLVGGEPTRRSGRDWRVLIPQEAYVFAGTLEENLAYYRPASRAEMEKAADALGIVRLISGLGGYAAQVAPETLSAGERQLIALARAYLSPAPVAILDEATCHLDPAAEERAEEAFARRGGTLIVIAHRITSARRAKRILVLDGARARVGGHAELLESSAMYQELAGHWFPPQISLNGHS